MNRFAQMNQILESGVIAVMRGMCVERVSQVAHALTTAGVKVLEITADSPGILHMVEQLRNSNDSGAVIGVGTVLDAQTARNAIMAGADFIFTPTLDLEVIEVANTYDKLVIPGVMTPTEMLAAYKAGALIVKVFPADTLGPEYIKSVKGPLPQIPMVPTGGITLENASEFIKAGAAAVGVGGSLLDKKALESGNYQVITERAQQFIEVITQARTGG
jgi:2-dehydro-3-deoxyphosphogluconate aldolase/(4S)-4-hydroxy-2-oxoglutarate aldolase